MDQLEKVEKIREKTGVSYEDAKSALEACNYDLLDAIVYLEKLGKIKAPEVGTYTTTPQETSNELAQAQAAYEQSCKKKTFGERMDEFFAWVGDIIKKGCEKNFIIERKGERFYADADHHIHTAFDLRILDLCTTFDHRTLLRLQVPFEGDAKTVQDINNACDKASDACAGVKEDIKK